MEGGAQGGALSCAFSAEPMLGYQQEFGDQRGNSFGCDDLELAAEAGDLPVSFPQFGTELFDRKLVQRQNGLIADSPHSEAKSAANLGRCFPDPEKNWPTAVARSAGCQLA
jgi:hypothetical protein